VSILIKETIELLKEVKSEYGDTESCALETLDKALENLAQLEQEQLSESDSAERALQIVSKVFRVLPQIIELLERFGLF